MVSFEDRLGAELHALRIMLCLIAVDHLEKYAHPLNALAALSESGHASIDAYRIKAESQDGENAYREIMHERVDAMTSTIHAALTQRPE